MTGCALIQIFFILLQPDKEQKMIIAQQKRKENIVEYLIYMWQVEDMIRACRFDADEIAERIVRQYGQTDEVNREIARWYGEIVDMMRSEGVTEKGHIQINRNVVLQLSGLHLRLLRSPSETVYGSLYYKALPAIVQLRAKSGGGEVSGTSGISEIETCLTAVYGYLLLRTQGKTISRETSESIRLIGDMLSFLAAKYNEDV